MARAIWKGVIQLEGSEIPVRLYSAVQDRTIRFHLLHDQDLQRVKQRLVDSDTGKTVSHRETQRGFPVERDTFVRLTEEELAALAPTRGREIEVLAFTPPEVINHQWYDRPYWLGPDGDPVAYFALAEALEQSGREGIVRWTMRDKQYQAALRVRDGYLMLITIRHADEIIETSQLPAPAGRALDAKEQAMAEQLIEALAEPFDPAKYHDQYRDRVAELIEAKRKGLEPPQQKPTAKPKPRSLADALSASLQSVGR